LEKFKMKIRLTCNWCDDKTLFERFQRVYCSVDNIIKDFEFTLSNNFDALVVINFSNEHLSFPKEKTLGVMMEPEWGCYFKTHLEQRCHHILYHKSSTSPQYVYYPGLLPPHIDYNSGENIDYYINNTFTKTKKSSIITSYNSSTPSNATIYHKRVNYAKMILQSDLDVDIYGNGWENSGIHDNV